MSREPEGVSTRSLLGAFFAVVVLCAVFFSLGFFLGYRQGRPANVLSTEQIPPPTDVPAGVNAPESSQSPSSSTDADSSTPSISQPVQADNSPGQQGAASSASSASRDVETAKRDSAAQDDGSLSSMTVPHLPPGVLVQVAAVTNRQDAANVVNVLKSKHYPALILTAAQAKAHDSYYRVVTGPYKSRTEAENVRKELTAEGFKPFIR